MRIKTEHETGKPLVCIFHLDIGNGNEPQRRPREHQRMKKRTTQKRIVKLVISKIEKSSFSSSLCFTIYKERERETK